MRVRIPSLQPIHLIFIVMKDSFKKIQSLADELAENADMSNGGGIIILAVNPNGEKGDPNSLVFIKGAF